jgi:hypothetical protein
MYTEDLDIVNRLIPVSSQIYQVIQQKIKLCEVSDLLAHAKGFGDSLHEGIVHLCSGG